MIAQLRILFAPIVEILRGSGQVRSTVAFLAAKVILKKVIQGRKWRIKTCQDNLDVLMAIAAPLCGYFYELWVALYLCATLFGLQMFCSPSSWFLQRYVSLFFTFFLCYIFKNMTAFLPEHMGMFLRTHHYAIVLQCALLSYKYYLPTLHKSFAL